MVNKEYVRGRQGDIETELRGIDIVLEYYYAQEKGEKVNLAKHELLVRNIFNDRIRCIRKKTC